jgi:glucosylceramidase
MSPRDGGHGAGSTSISRRRVIQRIALGAAAGWMSPVLAEHASARVDALAGTNETGTASAASVRWIATTQEHPWREQAGATVSPASFREPWHVEVGLDRPLQTIHGFGACFNELGWVALSALSEADQSAVFRELFAPGVGASFNVCRMPVGANDFSRGWYSYDETPDDFELRDFNIANDFDTLVPFIRTAKTHRPDLRLWASPWSPPTWMKRNRHYATSLSYPGQPPNGLRSGQVGTEGQDMFIQEERYLIAYAKYFARFVEDYRKQGIGISMVMPQNEFNSNQPFPSCCWSPEGLARFIPFLGGAMQKAGVEVFLGTMERPDPRLLDVPLGAPESRRYIKGLGLQWAGKHALPRLHEEHPELAIYQTEQECGDGQNDWRYCRYAWTLMRRYFEGGANAYEYWNIALQKGGLSRWGWAQNSLITVDPTTKTYLYNHEYYLLKHLSHFVQPGARRLDLLGWSGYDNLLAFGNPDGDVVVMTQNDMCQDLSLRLKVGEHVVSATLPPDSFSTFVIPAV